MGRAFLFRASNRLLVCRDIVTASLSIHGHARLFDPAEIIAPSGQGVQDQTSLTRRYTTHHVVVVLGGQSSIGGGDRKSEYLLNRHWQLWRPIPITRCRAPRS
jgi:hypothetical protein